MTKYGGAAASGYRRCGAGVESEFRCGGHHVVAGFRHKSYQCSCGGVFAVRDWWWSHAIRRCQTSDAGYRSIWRSAVDTFAVRAWRTRPTHSRFASLPQIGSVAYLRATSDLLLAQRLGTASVSPAKYRRRSPAAVRNLHVVQCSIQPVHLAMGFAAETHGTHSAHSINTPLHQKQKSTNRKDRYDTGKLN